MNEFEVSSWAELVAAVLAAGMPTFAEAKLNPTKITFGTCVYTFKEGLTLRRAEEIASNIRKVRRGR